MGNALASPPPGSNKFAGGLGKRRGASGRVDVFKQSQSSPSLATTAAAAAAPPMIPPPGPMMTPMSIPPQQEEASADQVGVDQTWQIPMPNIKLNQIYIQQNCTSVQILNEHPPN